MSSHVFVRTPEWCFRSHRIDKTNTAGLNVRIIRSSSDKMCYYTGHFRRSRVKESVVNDRDLWGVRHDDDDYTRGARITTTPRFLAQHPCRVAALHFYTQIQAVFREANLGVRME